MLREDFLESYLQYKLEEAFIHSKTPAPETAPYQNYYKAREIYKEVLEDDMLKEVVKEEEEGNIEYKTTEEKNSENLDNIDIVCLKAHVTFLLANNYYETEERGLAKKEFFSFLDIFSRLPFSKAVNFLNCVQFVFNALALIHINCDEDEIGHAYLLKAEKLYEQLKKLLMVKPISCYNTIDLYSAKLKFFNAIKNGEPVNENDGKIFRIYSKTSKIDVKPVFRFFYQGGLNIEKTEEQYTLTCFYLAQAKTKEGKKDKAANYCGITLKRQFDSGQYEPEEWCNNSMGLAEYYKQENLFSESMYIIFTALRVLPDSKEYEEMQASLHIMMGNILFAFFEYNSILIRTGVEERKDEEVKELEDFINSKELEFEENMVSFPVNKIYRNLNDIKTLFKMAMTEYKKALSIFVLDGYVTEHANILKQMSRLYLSISKLETKKSRIYAMNKRRAEMVEPLYKEISPKHYINLWRELCIELAQIYNELFETKRQEIFYSKNSEKMLKSKSKKTEKKLQEMNQNGTRAIELYTDVLNFFKSSDYNDEADNDDYIQSVVNARFAIAKIYSALFPKDTDDRIDCLRKSLENYQFIQDFIKEKGKQKGALSFNFSQQIKMCKEMCELLPVKIDKIRLGFMN